MPPQFALAACICCIGWLLFKDRRWHPGLTAGLVIPLLWMLIIGSRPLSFWFAPSLELDASESYVEGSPLDRWMFFVLILAGVGILWRRRISLGRLISNNTWLSLYFAYCGVSILWSDIPLDAFKRWTKDVGNVVMVLVVLSDSSPALAVRAILLRCAYVLIPLSVVLVKYFPDVSRFYDRWSGLASYTGVATDKNLFGMVLASLGIALTWAVVDPATNDLKIQRRMQVVVYATLLAATIWLLSIANSATAVFCFGLGSTILLFLKLEIIRKQVRAWTAVCVVAIAALSLSGAVAVGEHITDTLGRSENLTGRTDIWDAVLAENTNPAIGVGYYSFWTGERVSRLSSHYHYLLNEAHNGYLETYLNGGILGLVPLVFLLLVTANRSFRALEGSYDDGLAGIRLAIVASASFYALTEAVFSRLNLIWFELLLVAVAFPRTAARTALPDALGGTGGAGTARPREDPRA